MKTTKCAFHPDRAAVAQVNSEIVLDVRDPYVCDACKYSLQNQLPGIHFHSIASFDDYHKYERANYNQ